MTMIKNITLSICILSLVYVVLTVLTPDRYKQKMRYVVSLLTALTIAGAVLGTDISLPKDFIKSYGDLNGYVNADDMVISQLERNLEEHILSILKENDLPIEKISVKANIDSESCIFISKISLTVSGERDVYEQRIKKTVKERIGDISLDLHFSEEADES